MQQEYNWRKEREKYRPDFMKQPEPVEPQTPPPQPPPVIKRSNGGFVAAIIIIIIVAVITAIVIVSCAKSKISKQNNSTTDAKQTELDSGKATTEADAIPAGDPATMLSQAAERYKGAVGLVVLTVELKNGKKVPIPIGTAWAFDPRKFATNAHVAKGLIETRENAKKSLAARLAEDHAKQNGFKDLDAYLKHLGDQKAQEFINQCLEDAAKLIRGVEASILINGFYRKSYLVSEVQMHRDFGVAGSKFHPDVAVLTIDGKHDVYFKIASDGTLAELKSGEPIAFLGFPMEHLSNDNVNIDNPVASMQSGIVVAVSDFEMKNAGAEGNYLIRHNLPATGGASGSPIFNRNGEVIALLFAGNVIGQVKNSEVERAPSAAQINFAVRSDLLRGMGNPIDITEFLDR